MSIIVNFCHWRGCYTCIQLLNCSHPPQEYYHWRGCYTCIQLQNCSHPPQEYYHWRGCYTCIQLQNCSHPPQEYYHWRGCYTCIQLLNCSHPPQEYYYWRGCYTCIQLQNCSHPPQEYSPELQSISRRGKSNLNTGDGGIMITSIKHHSREGSYGSYTNEGSTEPPAQPQQQMSYNSQLSGNSYGAASSSGGLGNDRWGLHYRSFLSIYF